MTVAQWQPGTTYAPGALVVPRSTPVTSVVALTNGDLSGAGGWDLPSPLTSGTTGGYGGGGQIVLAVASGTVEALNQAHIGPIVAGQSVSAVCMGRHDGSNSHSSDVAIVIRWYDANDAQIGTGNHSDGLPSLSSSDWQQLTVKATAPAGAVYCRVGAGMNNDGTSTVGASHFSVSYTPQVTPRAAMYKATQAKPGKSGSTEPAWPPIGQSVQDNEVTWNGVNLDRLVWQASALLTSGATEPAWPTASGGAVHDGTIDWIATVPVVTDTNCPHSKIATIGASKIFVGDNDIVRFCATNNANDWTATQDAGYLPTGLQSATETECTALGLYRGNLAVFMPNTLQVWQIDPDPAQMSFMDQVPGIGTVYQRALCAMEGDLYFLSAMGVRSASISAGTANLAAGDVGTPIDPLVRADLAAYRTALASAAPPVWEPIGINFPSAGQFMLFMGDHAWVFTYSPAAQLAAWGRYTLPWIVTDACLLGGDLYVRADDNCVYRLDKDAEWNGDAAVDDTATATAPYTATVRWPYMDFGNTGGYLDAYGADVLFNEQVTGAAGNTSLAIGYDENDPTAMTDAIAVGSVEARGKSGFVPVEVNAPSVSLQVTYTGNGGWELTQTNLYIGGGPRAP